jgi:hypothetical protein
LSMSTKSLPAPFILANSKTMRQSYDVRPKLQT